MKLKDIKDTLNELLKADPAATDDLINVAVHVNNKVVNHPTIICWTRAEKAPMMLRLMGLLNGMISKSHPKRRIAAVYDENDKLEGFEIVHPEDITDEN